MRPNLPQQLAVALSTIVIWVAPTIVRAEIARATRFQYEPQAVMIGDSAAVLSGTFAIAEHRGSSQADGTLTLQARSGETLALKVIFGKPLSGQRVQSGKPLLIVAEDVEADPLAPPADRFVIGVVTPDATEVGCDIWIMTGSGVTGGTGIFGSHKIQFLAESTRSRVRHDFPRHDFGQIPSDVSVIAPPQTVQPINRDDPLDFASLVDIGRDNQAEGLIYAPLSDRGGAYKVCFGAVFPHAVLQFHLFIVGVLDNATDTDDVLRATVLPVPSNPDCQIWDLINGTSGQVPNTALFEAQTFVIWP